MYYTVILFFGYRSTTINENVYVFQIFKENSGFYLRRQVKTIHAFIVCTQNEMKVHHVH